jgi:hypothetical protein
VVFELPGLLRLHSFVENLTSETSSLRSAQFYLVLRFLAVDLNKSTERGQNGRAAEQEHQRMPFGTLYY